MMDHSVTDDVTISAAAPKKKKRLSVTERRAHVKLEILIEGNTNISGIAKKLGCGRKTIKDDINIMMAENEFWAHNMASVGWMTNVREMYRDSQIEIAQLKDVINNSYLTKTIIQPDGTTQRITVLNNISPTELSSLQTALTNKRKFVADLISNKVFYENTAQYAKFFQEHDDAWSKHDE